MLDFLTGPWFKWSLATVRETVRPCLEGAGEHEDLSEDFAIAKSRASEADREAKQVCHG